MSEWTNYLYIVGTILFTVYGQIVTKWQVNKLGPMPVALEERIWYVVQVLLNPWIISSLAAAFLAFLCWVVAMTKFELSYAYPFTSLSFALVLIASGLLFRETVNIWNILGVGFIAVGIYLGSQG